MHGNLAIYMYLKVVRLKTLDLGRFDWKVQASGLGIMIVLAVTFHMFGSFGCAGYW